MSGTNANSPPGPNGGGDPSMEDILASIRRILAEDEPAPEAAPNPAAATGATPAVNEDVLVLDSSMLAPAQPATQVAATPAAEPAKPEVVVVETVAESVIAMPAAAPHPAASAPHPAADEAVKTLQGNAWPCFEDAVRDALQPVLKQWLDSALPKLVERMVRTEVERVVGGVV